MTPQILLTPKDAAAALSISERTLATMTSEGKVESIKLGKSRRYLLKDLEEFCERQKDRDA